MLETWSVPRTSTREQKCMLGTYYQFLSQPINAIVKAGVCLIERKHLQLLRRIFHFIECVLISGDPGLGFVIFNVLLSGCCSCQQWRKATEAIFTQLSESRPMSWSLFLWFPNCSSGITKQIVNKCVPGPVHSIYPCSSNFGLLKHKVAFWQNRTELDQNYLNK